MNKRKLTAALIFVIGIMSVCSVQLTASEKTKDIILSAMKDELARNMNQLKVEGLSTPFFINYTIRDGKMYEIKAVLGSLVSSDENPIRNHDVRVMVGSYESNDENFLDMSSLYNRGSNSNYSRMPMEDDYNGIRRALWISTDNVFKNAAEQYERKKAGIKQQSLSKEIEALSDFSKAEPVKLIEHAEPIQFDKQGWEKFAKELSAIFEDYPEIYNSEVRIFFYYANEYMVNSEGSEIVKPLTLAGVQVNAYTQAEDGEELNDHVLRYSLNPAGLPSEDELEKEVKLMAGNLSNLKKAPVFDESYSGPVMFEDEAVSELFAQRFFRKYNGLLAVRKPFVSDVNAMAFVNQQYGETLEGRIDRRIISKDITIKALPQLKKFSGIPLIGSFDVDEEGIKPAKEIVLVENGILKTLLNNRTPSVKIPVSNGHERAIVSASWQVNSSLGASVIEVQSAKGMNDGDLKKELIQLAKDEGLDYGILVRKIKSTITGMTFTPDMAYSYYAGAGQQKKLLEQPVYVYRVYVEDGREELMRSAELEDVSINSLKHLGGVSNEQIVYNTLLQTTDFRYSPYDPSGVPASFIVPDKLLLEEMEVKKEKRNYTPKPPVVASPLIK